MQTEPPFLTEVDRLRIDMRVQLITEPSPHVVAPGGVHIPIPPEVHTPEGQVIAITTSAVIDVRGSRATRFYVDINIPSRSGDTRTVLGAVGHGAGGGAASAYVDRALRYTFPVRWVLSRPFAFIAGTVASNEFATEIQFEQQLSDGTVVEYFVAAIATEAASSR